MLGRVFDKKYQITALLGEGGMGSVYKGEHVHLKRDCAIKVIRREIASDPVALKRFKLEAEAASILKHPNIIEIYDFGITDEDLAYIVMEFLLGKSLDDVMERHKFLHYEQAIPIFLQVCDALAHAHSKGVLHRDLKPPNIMLTESEKGDIHVKLVDFGIAKIMAVAGHHNEKLTQTGEVFGSPMYMSPEQCMGQEIDGRSDLYSLACVMYETLTGKPPFSGDNFVQIVSKHLMQTPAAFAEIAPTIAIPAELEKIVMQCLSKDPDSRYSNVAELRKRLEMMFENKQTKDSKGKIVLGSETLKSNINAETAKWTPQDNLALEIASDDNDSQNKRVQPKGNSLHSEIDKTRPSLAVASSFPEAWSGYWGGTLTIESIYKPLSDKFAVGQWGLTVFHFVRQNANVNLKLPTIFLETEERPLKDYKYTVAGSFSVEMDRLKEKAKANEHELDQNQIIRTTPHIRLGNYSYVLLDGSSYTETIIANTVSEPSPDVYEQRVEKKLETHDTTTGLDTSAILEVIAQIKQNTPSSLSLHVEAIRYRMDRTVRSRMDFEGTLTRDWESYAEEISKRLLCSWKTIAEDFDI